MGKIMSPDNGSMDSRELVSKYLKEADILIKNKDFSAATQLVNKAKALQPSNPYVLAFIERIEYFKSLSNQDAIQKTTQPSTQKIDVMMTEKKEDIQSFAEDNLRKQIENEYQIKFKEELIKIESKIAKRLEEEKQKYEAEKEKLEKYYQEQIKTLKTNLDDEYKKRLEIELNAVEQQLKEQFLKEQEFLENEMKTRLEKEFNNKLQELQREHEHKTKILIENEKQAYIIKETELKKFYDEKLQAEINKLKLEQETLTLENLQKEKEKIKSTLSDEYEKHLEEEREKIKQFYEKEKINLQNQIAQKQKELEEKNQKILAQEIARLKEREKSELAKKQFELEEKIRNELTIYYNEQIELEKKRLNDKVRNFLEEKENERKLEEEKLILMENKRVEEIKTNLKKEMEEKYLKKLELLQEQFTKAYDYKMELLGVEIPTDIEEKYNLYKRRLKEFWKNGQPNVEQARKLMGLKELLELTFDEHAQLEIDVRHELYVTTIEEGIRKNLIDPSNTQYLDQLKSRYQITAEEASKLESYILSLFMKYSTRGVILIVDDDEALLNILSTELRQHNYKIITSTNVQDALTLLQKNSVDLVLCDIKFPDNQMDGFSFFTQVQKNPVLNRIPFILMSALGDGGIIRSGKQLGVDDYLTKPLDMDMLLSVIEGKIRRFRSISTTQ